MKKTITICIPVFNEEKNVATAIQAVESLFAKELAAYQHEIIVTDNGSSDETWQVIQKLGQGKKHIKAFRFSRNFGYQNSIFTGLSMSTGDAVVELDADLEDPPHVIPEFVRKWEEGFDVVYGVRRKRFAPLLLKGLLFIFYRTMNRVSELRIPENSGDFRLLDRKVVNLLKQLPERNLYLRGVVSYLGFKQTGVPYDRHPRKEGRSKFNFISYFIMAADALTAFSKVPLRMIGLMGVILFFFSSALALYYLIDHLIEGTPIAGFTTLVVLMLGLQSVGFIFMGILAEYLSRIFDDSKNRPRVIIADSLNSDQHPSTL
jgi:polyisoprenyl-phosphate glycosyltransferase